MVEYYSMSRLQNPQQFCRDSNPRSPTWEAGTSPLLGHGGIDESSKRYEQLYRILEYKYSSMNVLIQYKSAFLYTYGRFAYWQGIELHFLLVKELID